MNSESSFEWQISSWSGLPPWFNWALLVLLVGSGVALTVWLYRDTLRALTARQRLIFVLLRSGFIFVLMLCLAGPARVEKVYDSNQESRPLAVVVDRSASMNSADLNGLTRLTQSVRIWKKAEPEALHTFPSLAYLHFSKSLATDADLDSALSASVDGNGTRFYDSLNQALEKAPAGGFGGLVCLTDGLDTTGGSPTEVTTRAIQLHTPLYFAVGENRQTTPDSLIAREISVPGQMLRKSRFSAMILVTAYSSRERDVPLTLSVENQPVAQTTLRLRAGTNLVRWPVSLDAGEPGPLHLEYKVGDGAEQQTLAATIPVVAKDTVGVLFYQGTLDWGFRFINTALQADSSFAVTGLFNSSLNLTQTSTASGSSSLTELPDTAAGYQPYQIVVLSNVYADQMTPTQQNAVIDYVQGGGGLLFLAADNDIAQSFSNTPLESVMPVIFEATPKESARDESVRQFQDQMHSLGGSNFGKEGDFVSDALTQQEQQSLRNFSLPASLKRPEIASLFNAVPGGLIQHSPQFERYARVRGVKAGGEVLAVHPVDQTSDHEARALFVTQRFGQGRVTALLTDPLWRWRLSLPSSSHDPEVFWQQLFLALARLESAQPGLRFSQQPFSASLGQACSFRLEGARGSGAPVITAFAPGGGSQVQLAQPAEHGAWTFQFTPDKPGQWRIRAQDARGAMMETLVQVSAAALTDELSGLPPDMEGLRKLAEATGGAVLNDGIPDSWSAARTPGATTLVSKHSRPLWDNWGLLLLALSFYTVELIWRRRAKLL